MRFLLPIVLFLCCLACNSEKQQQASTTTTPQKTAPAGPSYPLYPMEKLKYLFDNSDYVDYVFYQLPISMSLSEKGSVQYAVSHVSMDKPTVDPNCKSIGRIFYQLKGENIAEAEIHFNKNAGCNYLMFYENGKKTYANLLTEQGVNYLNQNIANAAKGMQNALQQQQ